MVYTAVGQFHIGKMIYMKDLVRMMGWKSVRKDPKSTVSTIRSIYNAGKQNIYIFSVLCFALTGA